MTHYEIRNTDYTTLDRRMTFRFDFVQLESGGWQIYIVRQPSYGPRATGAGATHRLSDSRGQYVCWNAPIPTLDAAKGVARAWADATQAYIETGTFPPPGPSRPVPDWSSSAAWTFSARAGLVPDPPSAAARPAPPARPAPAAQTDRPTVARPSRPADARPSDSPNLRERLLRSWRNL